MDLLQFLTAEMQVFSLGIADPGEGERDLFSNMRKQGLPAFHFPVSLAVTEASPELFLTKEPCEKSNSGKCKALRFGLWTCFGAGGLRIYSVQ